MIASLNKMKGTYKPKQYHGPKLVIKKGYNQKSIRKNFKTINASRRIK